MESQSGVSGAGTHHAPAFQRHAPAAAERAPGGGSEVATGVGGGENMLRASEAPVTPAARVAAMSGSGSVAGSSSSAKSEEHAAGDMLATLLFSIFAYSGVSIAVVYFNWWLFTSGFKYPVFISWLQQVIGFGIFLVGARVGLYFSSWRAIFPPAAFDPAIIKSCVPLSIAFVLTIGLSNICLQKTLLSTYQVARSLTLMFVLVLSYVMLREKQSAIVIFAVSLLVVGFIIGSMDPSTLSLGGLLAGGMSSFFQAFYNVLIKYTLPHVGGNNQMLLFYNVMLSSMFFLPMALVCEGFAPFLSAFGFVSGVNFFTVWGGIALSGVLGTTLNMTQYLLIQVTTPLTFNIVGFVKAMVQSIGGIIFFGDPVSPASGVGILLCSIGSGIYTVAKHRTMQLQAKEQEQRAAQQIIVVDSAPSAHDHHRGQLPQDIEVAISDLSPPPSGAPAPAAPPPAASTPTGGRRRHGPPHSIIDDSPLSGGDSSAAPSPGAPDGGSTEATRTPESLAPDAKAAAARAEAEADADADTAAPPLRIIVNEPPPSAASS